MSLIGQLLKGIMSGAGWTAGKKLADDGIDKLREKYKERHDENKEQKSTGSGDALDKIEVGPDEDDKTE